MIKDYVVLDLETTGLNPKVDKIIEIGAIRVRNLEIVEAFSTYVNPGRSITSRITELTGITNDDVKDAPAIDDVIGNLLQFIGDDCLVGQNILFDYSFVKKAAVNKKMKFEKEGIDTLKIARRFLNELENRTLTKLCEHYGICLEAHRASNDAKATHEIYCKMLNDFYDKEKTLFEPKQLIYTVKKEGPITPKQIEQLKRLALKYNIAVENKTILQPDNRVIFDAQDILALTKNEASRLIDHLLSNYGR